MNTQSQGIIDHLHLKPFLVRRCGKRIGALGAGKISDKNESATLALEGRAQADQSRIERLKIEDQIRYSTVRIQIHSLPQIKRTMVANTEIRTAQQPFLARIGDALLDGWELVAFLFLGLLRFWSVGLLGGGLFWGLMKWRK